MRQAIERANQESSGARAYVLALYYFVTGNISLVIILMGVASIGLGATLVNGTPAIVIGGEDGFISLMNGLPDGVRSWSGRGHCPRPQGVRRDDGDLRGDSHRPRCEHLRVPVREQTVRAGDLVGLTGPPFLPFDHVPKRRVPVSSDIDPHRSTPVPASRPPSTSGR
ncbi:hypothetical protein ACFQL4_13275 [Halosimplex aquaticum]